MIKHNEQIEKTPSNALHYSAKPTQTVNKVKFDFFIDSTMWLTVKYSGSIELDFEN